MLWGSLVGAMLGLAYAHNANNRYEARTYFSILLGVPAAIGCVAGSAVLVAQLLDPGLQPLAKLLSAPEFALSAYGTLAVLAGAARAISAQPPEGGWPDFQRQPRP